MAISDWINSVLAAATVLMAAGTYKLAIDTAKSTKQAHQHHQENIHEAQERERMARHQLWESIAVLASTCVNAVNNLLEKYMTPIDSDS